MNAELSSRSTAAADNRFPETQPHSWQANLALILSTLIGAVLLVVLSPLLLVAALWLGWTQWTNFLARAAEARNYSATEGDGAALSNLSISGSGSAPSSTAR